MGFHGIASLIATEFTFVYRYCWHIGISLLGAHPESLINRVD